MAIALVAERGYEAATLREVANRAGVSPGLLYRYFPSKRAVVLELYDVLSRDYAGRAARMRAGTWRTRALHAIRTSLEVLGPHRQVLRALTGVLVADPEEGIFSERTAESRALVERPFVDAVSGATDAPAPGVARALGRLLYFLHLAVVLLWLLDRSREGRASLRVLPLIERTLRPVAISIALRPVQRFVIAAADVLGEALLDAPGR